MRCGYRHEDLVTKELTIKPSQGESTVKIVGMAGGKDARNELPTFGRHSTQFGVWIAKDHIKVEWLNEAIAHDNEFIHFLFVASCQNIELSANREKIRNKASSIYQALEDELSHYLSKVTHDSWFEQYLEARRQGEIERKASSESDKFGDRVERLTEEEFEPANKAEILFNLQQAIADDGQYSFTVEDYRPGSEVTAVVRRNDVLEAVAVSDTVYDHFDDESPLDPIDILVCWNLGDKDKLRELERAGYLGAEVQIEFDNQAIRYKRDNGIEGVIDIIIASNQIHSDQMIPEETPPKMLD